MKNLLLTALCVVLIVSNLSAQSHTPRYVSMASTTNGYYEYLPENYHSETGNYPVIIFFPGIGEVGNGSSSELPRVLANGTPKQINQGVFPTSFSVNGRTFKFIVITPQFTAYPSTYDIDDILDYVTANYRVDLNRIYITGLSWGGGMVWSYLCSGITMAGRVAAAVPVCGSADIASWGGGTLVANSDIPIWATHNNGDNVVPVSTTINNVNSVNSAPTPPSELARQTIFDASGHDAWTKTYDLNYKEGGYNVYEWMLLHSNDVMAPVPVRGLTFEIFNANPGVLLKWTTEYEINNLGFVVERSFDGISFDSIAFVEASGITSGISRYTYHDTHQPTAAVYYRLKQMDIGSGNFSYSPVRYLNVAAGETETSVFPNPVENKQVHLRFSNAPTDYFTVQLINDKGQTLYRKSITQTGSSLYQIQLPENIKRGVYTLRIIQKDRKNGDAVRLFVL